MIKSALSFFLLLVILTVFFPELAQTLVTVITRLLELVLAAINTWATQVPS